ncbi:MAG: ribonuclease E inhibitor RraB [Candidatus Dormibacteraeota bacterium]|nr:ribonuclease E inhibitor RraB [Candidatus Dormibacteraeota bacterium]
MLRRLFGTGQQSTRDAGDAKVLSQLSRVGSNLAREHQVENFLYLPDELSARASAARLEGAGYRVRIQDPADPGPGARWLVNAYRWVVPTAVAIAEIRARMEALATEFGGEYDGWGAEVVR